ncbi:glycerol-3-phosphate dehydrogenase [Coralliovum pocilloporae]|uniref:glycerol-3-phosphate dehydrogenase n=1 Tax=Coralliovum pocilloporae TaxID=3066369 RepID=UPI003307362F
MRTQVDIAIIGGGINGCGIARDAAGRGYSVLLCEQDDLASGTSSSSTKLIHGGLRYLEHYEFMLVRKALMEREVLWANAPHIIWPLRFVLPHHKGLRPSWLLRLGLFLYDHLGGRKLLPPTSTLNLKTDDAGKPLRGDFAKGYEYSDGWVDDARLVSLNAQDAARLGADIRTRTKCVGLERKGGQWVVEMEDRSTGERSLVEAATVVNAAGPWIDTLLTESLGQKDARNVRLVQGSHIVVPKLFDHDKCYIFQNDDGRIVFAIPYQGDFTLIGTTDHDYSGDPANARITDAETDYLCELASDYFTTTVTRDDVVWTYAGVRPLYDDGATKAQEATRDYVIRPDGSRDEGVLINIFGGKITTYRKLAEAVMDAVGDAIGSKGQTWTEVAPLPGGNFETEAFDRLLASTYAGYPFFDDKTLYRLVRAYGTQVPEIFGSARVLEDCGRNFGAGLTELEVRYLMQHEWAQTAEDVIWRRSKLGLWMTEEQVTALAQWMADMQEKSAA